MTPEEKKKGGSRLEHKNESPKKDKKARSRDEIIRRRVTILAVVAAAMLTMALGLKMWIREPEITPPPTPSQGAYEPGKEPVQVSGRKEGVYTFLLLGRDTGGGGNTDTMMVASYDTKNQTVNVLNIYRDTMVNAPWDIKRINSVYNFNGGGEEGIEALKGYLMDLLGFAPDYYITIEWDAVGELVDAIGGVEFDVPYEMHYWDPTQNLRIDQAKGYRTLYGDDAMQVIRWRKNNDGSGTSVGDVGRVSIQQDFLKAVVAKCLRTVNLSTVPKYAQIMLDNVTTDIPLGTIVWFGTQALGLDMSNLSFHGLPGKLNGSAWSRSYNNYQSYVLPDGEAIVELVNASFNPYMEDVELSDLDIMSVNRDGSLSSSRGVVRDTKAAKPPVVPTRAPAAPTDEVEEPGTGEVEPNDPVTSPSPDPLESQIPAPGESGAPSEWPSIPPEFQPSAEPGESDVPAVEDPAVEVTPTPGESGSPSPGPVESAGPAPIPTPIPTATPEVEISPEFLPAMPAPAA